jgi:hypothetical protein
VDLDLAALHRGSEPASREDALRSYAGLLLPGRDLAASLKLLAPMVAAPDLAGKVGSAAPKQAPRQPDRGEEEDRLLYGDLETRTSVRSMKVSDQLGKAGPDAQRSPSPLAQVVGVILGSPEFQRR